MRILVTGSTGLIGSNLVQQLQSADHDVTRLVRSRLPSGESQILWNPAQEQLNAEELEGFDAVVHLAGENIGAGKWTGERKARIRDSRVNGTQLLSERLAQLTQRPDVLVCSSAVGIYGDRGDEVLDESSEPGQGFLASVGQAWEGAADAARESGIRTVHLRFGMVLSKGGGALAKMLPPFRFCLGGTIGGGRQYWPWIHIADVLGVTQLVIQDPLFAGTVNVVSPQPTTNLEFTQALGWVLGRPTLIPLPAFAARLFLGEMADELLLASARVQPAKLLAANYAFQFPILESALTDILR